MKRLLVLLPWLMERGEVPVAEAAANFGLTEDEIAGDLELASMCGLPPFIDEMIDVFIDDGMIWVGVPRLFTRPLRLNSVEAWELLAAGRAAMELPGADPDGPLGRGLRKLAAAVGGDDTAGVTVALDRPASADVLADAVATNERIRIVYWSAARDETSERTIVPRRVFTDRGEWYVSADDDRSGEIRTFRLDRIESLDPTGEFADDHDDQVVELPAPGRWFTDATVDRVTLRLAPAAQWIVERYPVDEVSDPDERGRVEARFPVASERWFVRTMLRLGRDAEVVDPGDASDPVRTAARTIVERYRSE